MAPANQYVLILGASSGFGRAAATALASQGYHIIGVHLDRAAGIKQVDELKAELDALGVRHMFFNVNAADAERRADVLAAVAAEFTAHPGATIRMMLHSLAFGTLKELVATDMSQTISQKSLEMTLDVMANSIVYWTQDVLRNGLMTHGGRIVGLTSAGSARVLPMYGAVSAAKAALESYCRQLALELGPLGITANTIRAGVTETPALSKIPGNDVIMGYAMMRNPSHRLTKPEDVASVLTLLIRDEAQWINGEQLGVDGGEDAVDLTWWKSEA
ncbi:MAG: SDR family oxidoreductase [Candidatus Kapabacteria bacterium]|nr:SDR family oxidoreductase [Candidatus Kapabacteria bacterium]